MLPTPITQTHTPAASPPPRASDRKAVAFSRKKHASRKLDTDTVTPTLGNFAYFQQREAERLGYRIPKLVLDELTKHLFKLMADELVAGRHVCATEFGTFFLISRTQKGAIGGNVVRIKFVPAIKLKNKVAEALRG